MEQTIFAILTNKKARCPEVLEATLNREFVVGIEWSPWKIVDSQM